MEHGGDGEIGALVTILNVLIKELEDLEIREQLVIAMISDFLYIGMLSVGLVLWHINHCRFFNVKFYQY